MTSCSSVRIDVDQLLSDRDAERLNPPPITEPKKRKFDVFAAESKQKRPKIAKPSSTTKVSVTLKLPPKPEELDDFPCCLCVSASREGLLRVQDPPVGRRDLPESLATLFDANAWMAHEECAKVVPETWVDELDVISNSDVDGAVTTERRVFGVDAIVKDRWNLVSEL